MLDDDHHQSVMWPGWSEVEPLKVVVMGSGVVGCGRLLVLLIRGWRREDQDEVSARRAGLNCCIK